MLVCPNCGTQNPDQARFCMTCATPLSAPAAGEVRKSVTVVFADVAGSTALGERLDPESLRRVMGRYFDEMKRVVEHHGGQVEKFIGDAVMAVFGIPLLHEDDALRAVRAAVDMRDAAAALDQSLGERALSLQVRVGVNTGEVVAGDASVGQALVTGDAVNVAARLQQAASPGQILIGDATYRLVRDAVKAEPVAGLELKGKAEPLLAHLLIEVAAGAPAFARRLDSPLVGRQDELVILRQAFTRAVRERACFLFTVLGAAGVGKSRLAAEFLATAAAEATVLRGRCLSYGEGITFWPVAEAIKQAAGVSEDDSLTGGDARLGSLVAGVDSAPLIEAGLLQILGSGEGRMAAEESFWAVRKLLEALARRKPLVVVFDDIHWGEPTFLDLVEHIATWSRDAPLFMLCLARPELLDNRPGWGGGKLNATSILLGPLSELDCDDLIGNLLGEARLALEARSRISEAAEGNPLFVEQMLSMLIDDGFLQRADGHWVPTGDLAAVAVPPTIHALLSARLERLPPDERAVIERAAVVGKQFYRGAVAELSPEPLRLKVGDHLMNLVRKELIGFDPSTFAGEEVFRFRHLLIRDATYDAIPKQTRAELHARFAAWLERAVGPRLAEYEEIAAYHLEQAFRYRQELGLLDEETQALGRQGSQLLAEASDRAFGRGDLPAAANLMERARALSPAKDENWVDLSLELGQTLREMGEFREALVVLREALEQSHSLGDRRRNTYAQIHLLEVKQALEPEGFADEAAALAAKALRYFEREGNYVGLAKGSRLLALAHNMKATRAKQEQALLRAIESAHRAGDRRSELIDLAVLVSALYWGPTPVDEGVRRTEQALEEMQGSRLLEARALRYLAGFHGMKGRSEEARANLAQARTIFEDLGAQLWLDTMGFFIGPLELRAGRPAAAEAELRVNCDALRQRGEKSLLSSLAGLMAEALYRQGGDEEAEHYVRLSKESAASDDFQAQAYWRAVQAKIMARRGKFEASGPLIQEALGIIQQTDELDHNGDIFFFAAEVLILAGRLPEARESLRRAAEMYGRKGVQPSVQRVQDTLAQLSPKASG